MTWWNDLLGRKIEVKVEPGSKLEKFVTGSSTLPSSAAPSAPSGPKPPYAVEQSRYRVLSTGLGTEVATLHPSEVRSSYVRQAYVMMCMMLPPSQMPLPEVEIRHSFRPNTESGGLAYLETWMVRTYLKPRWGKMSGGIVNVQWMWRDQKWTQFMIYEYSVDTRETGTLWTDRVECDDSNEAAVHHGAFTGMMDFFTEQGE